MVKNSLFTLLLRSCGQKLLLTFCGQEWQLHISTDISLLGMAISQFYWKLVVKNLAISHCYWHLVVKNGNSQYFWHLNVRIGNFTFLLTSNDQKWPVSYCYWHLVVKNNNFTLLLTSSDQEWQFHISTDIWWSGMAIVYCYWHLWWSGMAIVPMLLTSGGSRIGIFHIATDISLSR